jgi:hypothetical protein
MSISDTSAPDGHLHISGLGWSAVRRSRCRCRVELITTRAAAPSVVRATSSDGTGARNPAVQLRGMAGRPSRWRLRADTAAAPRTPTIRHTCADGTLLAGVTRPDDPTAPCAVWAGCTGAAAMTTGRRRQDKPAKTGAIEQTVQVLQGRGFAVTVTIDTESRPVAAAETERGERAQIRAGRCTAAPTGSTSSPRPPRRRLAASRQHSAGPALHRGPRGAGPTGAAARARSHRSPIRRARPRSC